MKSKKIFTITILVMATCLFLVACGTKNTASNSSATQESNDSKEDTETKDIKTPNVSDDNAGDKAEQDIKTSGDVGDTEVYNRTKGLWCLDGESNTASIEMDGLGGFISYYGSGTKEYYGYLEYDNENNKYKAYDASGSFIADIYFDSDTQLHFDNENESIYLKVEGDVPEENVVQIPVLMGGAMFTGLKPLDTENYADGGYYYSEITEDDMTVIINAAYSNSLGDNESIEDYIINCAHDLGDDVVRDSKITLNKKYTNKFTYPVYLVSWFTGENEDTKRWEMFFFMTDSHTYMYSFNSKADNAEEMLDVWTEAFDSLYLE